MAESVSLSSDLQNLATGARQTCTWVLRTIKDVKDIDLEEFRKELEALVTTLNSLTTSSTDLSALRLSLQGCRTACDDFGQQIEKCLSPASGSSMAIPDAYLGFRQLLAAYKATFDIALERPNLLVLIFPSMLTWLTHLVISQLQNVVSYRKQQALRGSYTKC
jgi:hypothetical protein